MSDDFLPHVIEANRAFSDQIKTADQKAAYIFTFVVALLVWSSETRKAFNWAHLREMPLAGACAGIILAASIIVAVAAAILVVLPRVRPGTSVFYWGAWPKAGERVRAARRDGNADFFFEEYMQNTTTLAGIAHAKFRLVAVAFRALFVGMLAYAALLVLAP